MKSIAVVRIAKVIALVGFFLPWVLVSCSSQPIAAFSGVELATGDLSFKNPISGAIQQQHASPNLFLVVAILAIAGGLAYSFRASTISSQKPAARVLLAAAAAGAAFSAIGAMAVLSGRDQAVSQAQAQNQYAGGAAGAIQMSLQYGFWITLLSLVTAGAAAWLIMTERESMLNAIGGEARRLAAVAGGGDEAYWDRLPDKNDPSALEEYLHRFPDGKLASLARARLERRGLGIAPADAAVGDPTAGPEPAPTGAPTPVSTSSAAATKAVCGDCGASVSESDRFCGGCGAALADAKVRS